MALYQNCRHYLGAKPCRWNKEDGSECGTACMHHEPTIDRVLIIKLDAPGDVLRTASLLPAIIALHRSPHIAWLTRPGPAAELVGMMALVDEVIELTPEGLARISTTTWTQVYSLSNDVPSAALTAKAAGRFPPVGFRSDSLGHIQPSNDAALAWLEMASFDRIKRANLRTWQWHMLGMIGSDAAPQPPKLRLPNVQREPGLVAINVGAGKRWPKKMLGAHQIIDVIEALQNIRADVPILLTGGPDERGTIAFIAARTANTEGHATDSIAGFVATLMRASVLLCGDTLAMHIATAIGLSTVAVFGPTGIHEIEPFGVIDKVQATGLDCLGCYGDCDKARNCMSAMDPPEIAGRIAAKIGTAEVGRAHTPVQPVAVMA